MSEQHARVAVIGGGIVGCSILYHLVKLGWSDVVLLERAELTSGSTWHAAGGMHTLNGDPNVAALQKYTLALYEEVEAAAGTPVGIHRTGCVYLAATEQELDFFRAERTKARTLGIELDFISLERVAELNPLVDTRQFRAAMFDPNDGHIDPSAITHALAQVARARGATVLRHRPVTAIERTRSGEWRLQTPQGAIVAEHVVNAAGLWAREVAALAGHRVPVVPLEHQYVVTNDIPQLAKQPTELATVVDFNGACYVRQEGRALLLGTYEQDCRHWALEGTPLDFGVELLPPDLERLGPELEAAARRFPVLNEAGIKRAVNGAIMFTPDGNPAIGPVPGLRNFHAAVGCMAGFSQGGGVGLALASWIVHGDPGVDTFAMDITRFGDYATDAFVRARSRENYQRRFILPCPNEELVAARPTRSSPLHEQLSARGAVFGAAAGWEVPLWFARSREEARETPSFRRSNAFPYIVEEWRAVREAVGLWDISSYCKLELQGPGAEPWLDGIVANQLPRAVGRIALCPMLTPAGRILGDVTILKLGPQRYWMLGSPMAEAYYLRWLEQHRDRDDFSVRSVSEERAGVAITGPRARELLQRICSEDVSNAGLPFLSLKSVEVSGVRALVARISFTGELGYEIYAARGELESLYRRLLEAGRDLGLRHFGVRALNVLRLEKGYGGWGRELTVDVDPFEAGLERFVKIREKPRFIGREALQRSAARAPARRLRLLRIDSKDVDASGGEPVLDAGRTIARLTSAAWSPLLQASLGFSYLPTSVIDARPLEVEILGERCRATVLEAPPHDPSGARLRA